jgi:hypothetical protein
VGGSGVSRGDAESVLVQQRMVHREGTLVRCNLRSITRNKLNQNLFLLSSFFLFGLLLVMWYLTAGTNLTYLADDVSILYSLPH